MTQPSFVPIVEVDQVRPAYRLRTTSDWRADRVADLRAPDHPRGRDLGIPGPDQGYALLLAHKVFEDRLELTAGITSEDALIGAVGVAGARAALFGRAPVATDVEVALVLFGFLGDAPAELVAWRAPIFEGAAHHYDQQRRIAQAVPEAALRLSPEQARSRLSGWRAMLDVRV
ncbi:MAG: hypothetical protein ACYDB3_09995 [Acidimicrobiales bacterium]